MRHTRLRTQGERGHTTKSPESRTLGKLEPATDGMRISRLEGRYTVPQPLSILSLCHTRCIMVRYPSPSVLSSITSPDDVEDKGKRC